MADSSWSGAASAGLVIGELALIGHLVGAWLAMRTPLDNQGAVGKAYVAIGTSCLVYPFALLGLILCLVSRRKDGRKSWAWLGLVVCGLALIPWAMVLGPLMRL